LKTNYLYFLLIFLSIIWGSSFILIKKSLLVFSDYEVALLRMVIAWLILIPITLKKFFSLKKKIILPILVVAFLGNAFPAFLFAKAQTQINSSTVGILNSLVPIFTILIGFLFKNKASTKQLLGVLIGFVGAVHLFAGDVNLGIFNSYSLLIILASIFYAINLNTIKSFLKKTSAVEIAGYAFLIIGPISTFLLLFSDFFDKMNNHSGAYEALFYVFILGAFGTSFAIIIFNYLIIKTSAIFTSSVTYLIPIIALIWGVIDGEIINENHIFSLLIIILGVYLTNK
tara:strand:- start:2787 stop:3641 length:855 start_codon:yes stop_codon:yes gene_type:complete